MLGSGFFGACPNLCFLLTLKCSAEVFLLISLRMLDPSFIVPEVSDDLFGCRFLLRLKPPMCILRSDGRLIESFSVCWGRQIPRTREVDKKVNK